MDALAERLNIRLNEWQPNIAEQVKERILEIIDLADQDCIDILHSRVIEQEILDLIDQP